MQVNSQPNNPHADLQLSYDGAIWDIIITICKDGRLVVKTVSVCHPIPFDIELTVFSNWQMFEWGSFDFSRLSCEYCPPKPSNKYQTRQEKNGLVAVDKKLQTAIDELRNKELKAA
jgi:hypothetical protein